MALVHMIDLGLAAERMEESDAAETEDSLLAETIVGITAVEMIGKAAVPRIIAFDVGVE